MSRSNRSSMRRFAAADEVRTMRTMTPRNSAMCPDTVAARLRNSLTARSVPRASLVTVSI
jgi:hypothetical protein